MYLKIFFIFIMLIPNAYNSRSMNDSTIDSMGSGIKITNVRRIARITGSPQPGEGLPSPNNTPLPYDVAATDLGIMWHISDTTIGMFFGDTFGKGFAPNAKGGGNGHNWRSNVLAFSNDTNLEDGLLLNNWAIDASGEAKEICVGIKTLGNKPYQTSIPTGAIHADNGDYVHYMNIYKWDMPDGRWLTNFSSLYASYDSGKSWQRKSEITFSANSKFSQVCYAKKDGYVYMIGTLAGRGSAAYLARFKERDILNKKQYEYWNENKKQWVRNDERAATPVIPAPVGEASLLYNEKYKRWIITYTYDAAFDKQATTKMVALAYRDCAELTAAWSTMKILATNKEYPGLYAPFIYPLKDEGDKIYFTMSIWFPYNVFLMSADIKL